MELIDRRFLGQQSRRSCLQHRDVFMTRMAVAHSWSPPYRESYYATGKSRAVWSAMGSFGQFVGSWENDGSL